MWLVVRAGLFLMGGILLLLTAGLAYLRQSPGGAALLTYAAQSTDYHSNIYLHTPTTRPLRLTNTREAWLPRWSADGRQIAFLAYEDHISRLYVMRPNGQHKQRVPVTDNIVDYQWSPNSQFLLMEVVTAARRHTLLIWDSPTNTIYPLDFLTGEAFIGYYPSAWSPDSQEFVFTLMTDEFDFELWRSGLSAPPVFVTPEAYSPAWSPDGNWIAFVKGDDGVHKIRPDGQDLQRLTPAHQEETSLIWARDSQHLLTEAVFDQPPTGHIIAPESSRRLPKMLYQLAGWSPDMAWIAFSSYPTHQLYQMRPDGRDLHVLTDFPVRDPAWSPPLALAYRVERLLLMALLCIVLALNTGHMADQNP